MEGNVINAARKAVQDPESAVNALVNLDNPALLSIFFIRPTNKADIHHNIHIIYIPTHWLISQIVKAIITQIDVAQIEFFNVLNGYPKTHSTASQIFEEFIHHFLANGKSFTIHWYDTQTQAGSSKTLSLPHLHTYTDVGSLATPSPFYWHPSSHHYPGIDGAIVTKDHVYVIQATIQWHGDKSLQVGVDQLWQSMPPAKKSLDWSLLFVGPTENQTKAVSRPYIHELRIGNSEDTRQQKKARITARTHLPVGGVSVFPTIPGSEYMVSNEIHHKENTILNVVHMEEFDMGSDNVHDPEEASTSIGMGTSQGVERSHRYFLRGR